ncbi:Hermansky-Pudlak syndrome 1 protein-like protein [Frankliniella fusca]|uniref:Hermansky-Pudlak syndrome 1 protein-like protein n=1 Tax=Frankliniella fusca TaxID=407009 RepID=A0AAE1I1I8_9NEOP|nr:Hermansky-Pudlak syndrome 1 protein-like protein [Frankliniella fusca]
MRCILIFDHLNDILYTKCNSKFIQHVRKLATSQGLLPQSDMAVEDSKLSSNIIIQLFSPMVTSQRVMSCQFGNSYTFIQCQDGTNMVFDEYMGYLFIHIGCEEVNRLKRGLGVCISFVKHLCGPDVSLLKINQSRADLLTQLMDTWISLQDSEQWLLVEAVEQLTVNAELSGATLKTLQTAVDKMRSVDELQRVHAMILVRNKFLSLYSSKNTQDLSAADLIFLNILTETVQQEESQPKTNLSQNSDSGVSGESSDEFYSPSGSAESSPNASPKSIRRFPSSTLNESVSPIRVTVSHDLISHLVLLSGVPYAVHMASMAPGVTLLLMVQTPMGPLCSGLSDALQALNVLQTLQVQKDLEGVKLAFEALDGSMKRAFDGLKKVKATASSVETCSSKLQGVWDFMKRKYIEYMKTAEPDCLLRIESSSAGFQSLLCELLWRACLDSIALRAAVSGIESGAEHVRKGLHDFSSFLQVKALCNFTLGSYPLLLFSYAVCKILHTLCFAYINFGFAYGTLSNVYVVVLSLISLTRASLTINKYLEEFPGLVHFIYVDRSNHRVTAPSLDFSAQETVTLTKKKIWWMVELSRSHLQDGHFALMWKDTTFNYAYFLWFEDASGSPLKPKVLPTSALKTFPPPGVMCGDFYSKLIECCFPKTSPNKIRCFELMCIHLGLATSSCVLEHSRRLAATIWEVTGMPGSPLDLL